MSYRNHLRQASDLKTPPADTRAGFVEMAVERSARAVPYVSEAKALHAAASNTESPEQLLGLSAIRSGLISAAGISDKASGHMLDEDKTQAINDLIANHLETAGSSYIEELVYRFLLTKGDTLGGSMRNVTGTLAGRKLIRGILVGFPAHRKTRGSKLNYVLSLGQIARGRVSSYSTAMPQW